MKKVKRKLKVETAEDRDLKAAIDSVYQKYGTNLRAFFNDIHDELMLKRQEESRKLNHVW